MNIVAIGDVILDNYHKDNSKLGYYLGGSILNDLINFSLIFLLLSEDLLQSPSLLLSYR